MGTTERPADGPGRDPVEVLAEEFAARCRRGESPDPSAFAARCPARAAEILELFPAIAAIERCKPAGLPSDDEPVALDRLGPFRLVAEIGRGGMGVVYEAVQETLDRVVAVKLLPGISPADGRSRAQLAREARAAARLTHPHIVPVFEFGEHRGRPYIVMPRIPGVGLDRVIRAVRRIRRGRLPDPGGDAGRAARALLADGVAGPGYARAVAWIGVQVAGALQHAHDLGVLHRDIKPGNILVGADGFAWVADFGLARGSLGDDLGAPGDPGGTARYMAPERRQGRCDARSEVYSLGLTLYELATLRAARPDPTAGGSTGPPPEPPRAVDPALPRDLEAIILRAIDPDPAGRYATAAELAEDLERFAEGLPIRGRQVTPRFRAGACLAVAATAGVAVLLTYGAWRAWLDATPSGPAWWPPEVAWAR